MTPEHKKAISEAHKKKGPLHWTKRPEVRKRMSASRKGQKNRLGTKQSEATKKKLSEITKEQWQNGQFGRGDKSHAWKGGVTPKHTAIRMSLEYKLWRTAVFLRDNRTCIWCGSTKNIEADHIKPFSLFPELRFAIDNGRTLCHECHRMTPTYGNVNH